jgi:hypothetical protein
MGTNSVGERQSEELFSPPPPRSGPIQGDVLASRPTARADLYLISVVPSIEHTTARRYPEAIETVRTLARQRRVDGWFTCNHTHYARIAQYRP